MGKYSPSGNVSTSTEGHNPAINPTPNRAGSMESGGIDGAGETCVNKPNPYGYNPDKSGPSYEKTRGRRG